MPSVSETGCRIDAAYERTWRC